MVLNRIAVKIKQISNVLQKFYAQRICPSAPAHYTMMARERGSKNSPNLLSKLSRNEQDRKWSNSKQADPIVSDTDTVEILGSTHLYVNLRAVITSLDQFLVIARTPMYT